MSLIICTCLASGAGDYDEPPPAERGRSERASFTDGNAEGTA